MRGVWTAVRKILVPFAWKTASKDWVKFDPRSRARNLKSWSRSPRLMARLRACCMVHSPVGFAVTPPRCIRRVPCSMNTRTYSRFSAPQHRVLVPERQQFGIFGRVVAEDKDGEAEYPANHQVDDREQHLASQPSPP
jgi:hypothetical protein